MEIIYQVRDVSSPFEHNWKTKAFKNPEDAWKFMKGTYAAPIRDEQFHKDISIDEFKDITANNVGTCMVFTQTICGWDDDNTLVSSTDIYEVTVLKVE